MTNPTDREEGFVEDQRRLRVTARAQGMTLPLSQSEQLKEANALLAEAADVLRSIPPIAQLVFWYEDRAKPLLDKLGERE